MSITNQIASEMKTLHKVRILFDLFIRSTLNTLEFGAVDLDFISFLHLGPTRLLHRKLKSVKSRRFCTERSS